MNDVTIVNSPLLHGLKGLYRADTESQYIYFQHFLYLFCWSTYKRGENICETSECQMCQNRLLASLVIFVRLSIPLHGTTQFPLDGFPLSFHFMIFLHSIYQYKFKFDQNLRRMAFTLEVLLCTFTIISHWILCRLRYVPEIGYREILALNLYFKHFSEIHLLYAIM